MALTYEASQAEVEEILIPPTEREWLELRRPYWNASLAACLFDEHPYVSLGDAVTEKLRPEFQVVDEDQAKLFKRGLDMEPYIAQIASEMTGMQLERPTHMVRRGVMLCTPDYLDRDRPETGLEVKSTRNFLKNVLPRYWMWQCLAQCWCMDWERVVLAALDATLEVTLFEVERDDDAIRVMMERATHYINILSLGEVPDGVELSAGNVTAIWPKDTGELIDLPAEYVGPLKMYLQYRAEEKKAKENKERARDEVVAQIGPAAGAVLGGVEVATYRASKDREVVDWKRMIAENPELAAKYTETKAGPRSFHIKDKSVDALIAQIGEAQDGIDW